jgi:hypothetical protein
MLLRLATSHLSGGSLESFNRAMDGIESSPQSCCQLKKNAIERSTGTNNLDLPPRKIKPMSISVGIAKFLHARIGGSRTNPIF